MQLWIGVSVAWCEQWTENFVEAVRKQKPGVLCDVRMGVWIQQSEIHNASHKWRYWGTVDWLGTPTFTIGLSLWQCWFCVRYYVYSFANYCDVWNMDSDTAACCLAVAFIRFSELDILKAINCFFLLRVFWVFWCPLDRLPARRRVSLVVGLPPWCL